MSGTMPYSLEKGPYLSVMEDFANAGLSRLVQTLDDLRNGVPIAQNPVLASPALDGGPYDFPARVQHVNRHWFGMTQDAAGAWVPQAQFDPVNNPTTGFWLHWYGDAESIFRRTLIRAVEVSLGLDHGQDARRRTRHWPIHYLWKCPQPWYEGWVTWRRQAGGATAGQVTAIFATPGHGEGLRNTPLAPPNAKAKEGYEVAPQKCSGDNGMWVITHGYQEPRLTTTTTPSPMGAWPTIGTAYQSRGPVICVAPAEAEGGVLPGGRAYVAAP